jgi:hypothetical protein
VRFEDLKNKDRVESVIKSEFVRFKGFHVIDANKIGKMAFVLLINDFSPYDIWDFISYFLLRVCSENEYKFGEYIDWIRKNAKVYKVENKTP